jgi:hypothetical protein
MADETKQKNITRAQKAKDAYAKGSQDRASDITTLKYEYRKRQEERDPVLRDILAKAQAFITYHNRVARDGVAYTEQKEIMDLSSERRIRELDRASGLQELVDYIERQCKDDPPAGSVDGSVH